MVCAAASKVSIAGAKHFNVFHVVGWQSPKPFCATAVCSLHAVLCIEETHGQVDTRSTSSWQCIESCLDMTWVHHQQLWSCLRQLYRIIPIQPHCITQTLNPDLQVFSIQPDNHHML